MIISCYAFFRECSDHKALQTYCNISIYDVWDYNEKYKEFQLDSSLGLYINSNRLKQALEKAVTEQRDSAKQQ